MQSIEEVAKSASLAIHGEIKKPNFKFETNANDFEEKFSTDAVNEFYLSICKELQGHDQLLKEIKFASPKILVVPSEENEDMTIKATSEISHSKGKGTFTFCAHLTFNKSKKCFYDKIKFGTAHRFLVSLSKPLEYTLSV